MSIAGLGLTSHIGDEVNAYLFIADHGLHSLNNQIAIRNSGDKTS